MLRPTGGAERGIRSLRALSNHLSASACAGASAAADVDAVLAAVANGARGTRENSPHDGRNVSGLPPIPPASFNHYLATTPRVHPTALVAPSAELLGGCVIGEDASVWFGTVLRADDEPIIIGKGSNVQDGCVLHIDPGNPLVIGENVTIGHGAILHGCVIEDDAMVAIGPHLVVFSGVSKCKNAEFARFLHFQ